MPGMLAHQAGCGKYAALYREHPELCLLPAEEYRRWRAEDRASEITDRIAAKVEATDVLRSAMADRFRTPDILEDL